MPFGDEVLALLIVDFLDPVGRHIHVGETRRLEAFVLVGLADIDRTAHRNVQIGGGRLLIIGRLRRPDEERDENVGLGLLDVLNGRRELRHAKGYEFLADHFTAVLLDDVAHPLGRDLTEVVVGGDRVNFLAELLHHPGDQRRKLLLGNRAGHDHMRVADAAFVLVVVEGKAVELVDDRPVSFARGA